MAAPSALTTCLLLGRADAEVTRRFDASLSSFHGLSRNDYALLRTLSEEPSGGLRRVDLARRLGVTPSGATRMLHPLERIGLVTREANPGDARAALATLTTAGRQMVEDATATAERVAEAVLDGMTAADRTALATALARLVPAV